MLTSTLIMENPSLNEMVIRAANESKKLDPTSFENIGCLSRAGLHKRWRHAWMGRYKG